MAHSIPRKLADIPDGTSNTLLISELAGRPDYWIKGVKQPTQGERFAAWWGPWASYNCAIYKTWSDDGQTPGGFYVPPESFFRVVRSRLFPGGWLYYDG